MYIQGYGLHQMIYWWRPGIKFLINALHSWRLEKFDLHKSGYKLGGGGGVIIFLKIFLIYIHEQFGLLLMYKK